jgi:GNAT superfamily N-acetyltransferase
LEKWSKKYKSSIDCSHPRGFSQRAHCQGRKKHNEDVEAGTESTLIDALRDFFPVAMQHLDLDHLPRITFVPEVTGHHAPTFGKFMNAENTIFVDIENRHPNDILRTLAHELVHYRQMMDHQLDDSSGETGSDEENQANAQAGVIMRNFNQQYPEYLELEPVILPAKKTHISESDDATPAQQWIRKIYSVSGDEFHEHPFNPRYRVMTWGSGDDQELAIFELAPVFGKPTTVDIKWFQAYPQRQGIGTRAMQRLQQLALEHGITLTIYPWNRGEVSQSKLTKIYRGMGFRPTVRGAKDMSWQPQQNPSLSETHSPTTANEGRRVMPAADVQSGAVKLYGYIKRNLTDLASMTKFHEDYNESFVDENLDNLFGQGIRVAFDSGSSIEFDDGFLYIPLTKMWTYRALISPNQFVTEVVKELSKMSNVTQTSVAENFKDGRHPEDKGDSKRYGVPTRASVSTLRKVAKQGGRKGQLAHWMANMKAGRAKAKK